MPPKSKTATSTPRLSEYSLAFKFPQGIKKTVWTRVEAKGKELDLGFDWWQSQLGTVCLGYGEDGQYVATVGGIGLSIPRQVGKTYFVLATLVIMCILFPGLQVVWTAHHLRTSTKTFTTLRGICRRKKVAPHIAIDGRGQPAIRSSNGEQQVVFRNGSTIMFGARSMGFGRGFDEIDIEVFDEAQILDSKALEDMVAATNQARHEHGALLFFMGTPPGPSDPSEAFSLRRADAHRGEAADAVWLEIGADPDSEPYDPRQYPKMNPSFPKRTPLNSILRLQKNLGNPESWDREGRGIWDEIGVTHVFGPGAWEACAVKDLPPAVDAIGLAVSVDRAWSSIGAAGTSGDRLAVGVTARREGTGWLVPEAKRIQAERGCPVVIAGTGPAADLIPALEAAGVRLTIAKTGDSADACAGIFDAVREGRLSHPNHPELNAAVAGAKKRNTDRWSWDRRNSAHDISPLEAVTLAHWAAVNAPTYDLLDSIG